MRYLILLFAFVCWYVAEAGAQTIVTVEKHISQVLYFANGSSRTVNFHGKYTSHDRKYEITTDADTNKIEFYDPLKFNVLRSKLNEYAQDHLGNDKGITTSTLNDVFSWIYDLKNEKDDAPASGMLKFKRMVMLMSSEKTSHFKYAQRSKLVDSFDNRYSVVSGSLLSSEYKFRAFIDTLNKRNDIARSDTSLKKDSVNNIHKAFNGIIRNYTDHSYHPDMLTKALISAGLANHPYKDTLSKLFLAYEQSRTKMAEMLKDMEKLQLFRIKNVNIQFERGFIENMKVIVDIHGTDQVFETNYAIGFTSSLNYRGLYYQLLWARNKFLIGSDDEPRANIYLIDIFEPYDNYLENYTRDYSPADTTISIDPAEEPQVELKRSRLVNLFDAKAYTDLIGNNRNAPNGLVQIEVSKRFNVHTKRTPTYTFNTGFVNYLYLYGALTKIEDKEKYLMLGNNNLVLNNVVVSPYYATNLDIRRYENASLGLELNALVFDNPHWKYTFYADAGLRYGHTPIQYVRTRVDSLANSVSPIQAGDTVTGLPAHTFTIYPKLSLELFSERRVGLQFTYQLNYTILFSNNQFKQIVSYQKSDLDAPLIERYARVSHMMEFFLRIETSKEQRSRLFLRTRFYIQKGDWNTFFPQLQLGYAYDLFLRK